MSCFTHSCPAISKPLAQRNVQVLTHESLVKVQKNKVPSALLSEQQSDSSQAFNLLNSETRGNSPFTTPPDTPTTSTSFGRQMEDGGQAPIAPWSLDTESVPAQESQPSLSEPKIDESLFTESRSPSPQGVQAEGAGSPELDTDKEIKDELWETIRPMQHSTTMDRSTSIFRSSSEKSYVEAKPRAQLLTNQKKTKTLAKLPTNKKDLKGKQCTVKGEEFILSLDEMLKAPEAKREGKGVAYHASGQKVRSDSKRA
ncbi:hypothetical protein BDP27DRAFT_1371099 [Rhodocollybia butyracea]|uniref:Uncharacterized protein n=1 Tax=Rhodocollybia butyracea TaxID=206335 RepID=A0A9P5P7Q6_9AGAR|nr:hypothetical protein BDP27DRAFT_1371099 [Rhodocollybia butyracea]